MQYADCRILIYIRRISFISEFLAGVAEKWGGAEVQAEITPESKVHDHESDSDFSWKTVEGIIDIKSAWALVYRDVIHIKNDHILKRYNFLLTKQLILAPN